MSSRPSTFIPTALLVVLDVAALAALLAVHPVNEAVLEIRLLDMDDEGNVPTWFATMNFGLAGLVGLLAALNNRGGARLAWLFVGSCLVAFSVDEAVAVHEIVGRRLGDVTTLSLAQPVTAVLVATSFLLAARVVPLGGRLLRCAGGVLVLSQACASAAGLFLGGAWRFVFEAVEEATETLTGIVVLTAGLTALGAVAVPRPSTVRTQWRQLVHVAGDRPGDVSGDPVRPPAGPGARSTPARVGQVPRA